MLAVLERTRRYLAKCPPAISGQGGHNSTFHVASVLIHGFALGEADALALFREWNVRCVPPWTEADLLHKLRTAAAAPDAKGRGYLLGGKGLAGGKESAASTAGRAIVSPPKPKFSPMALKRLAAKLDSVANIAAFVRERSPVRADAQDSASFLRWCYPRGSGEKILIFSDMKSQGQMVWLADRSDSIQDCHLPRGKDGVWFLPQPVDGLRHPNPRQGGKLSRRSEESVIAWRYALLESDEADPLDWLRCLAQMPLRITSICESGGRSIHALVRLDAMSKADWDAKVRSIKPVVVTLGADPGALSAVRLTRLPQAKRGERVQRLLYLNPQPDGVAITQREPLRVEQPREGVI